ncbi:MAG TPA: hypothetical protein VKZ97_09505 [Flavobacteriaceae bacterium]|nr:hypothetical protein [Flavobacteriaceae bacterium]
MNKSFCKALCSLAFLWVFQFSQAQDKNYLVAFDSIVKLENTGLYNGKVYKDRYRSFPDNHRYFESHDFIIGDVEYNGQHYYQIGLKYNLHEDVLVVRPKGSKSFVNLQLISDKITSFKLNNTTFINTDKTVTTNTTGYRGFMALSYSGEQLNLFVKHTKTVRDKYVGKKIEYIFNAENHYFLHYNQELIELKNKKQIRKLFPSLVNDINTHYKNNSKAEKLNPEAFYTGLIKVLDSKLSTKL